MRPRAKLLAVIGIISLAGVLVWSAYGSSSHATAPAAAQEVCPPVASSGAPPICCPPGDAGTQAATQALPIFCGYKGKGTPPKVAPTGQHSSVGMCDPSGQYFEVADSEGDAVAAEGNTFAIYVQGLGVGCKLTDTQFGGLDPSKCTLMPDVLADPGGNLYGKDDPNYNRGVVRYPYYVCT
jgi:hypothetical protein